VYCYHHVEVGYVIPGPVLLRWWAAERHRRWAG